MGGVSEGGTSCPHWPVEVRVVCLQLMWTEWHVFLVASKKDTKQSRGRSFRAMPRSYRHLKWNLSEGFSVCSYVTSLTSLYSHFLCLTFPPPPPPPPASFLLISPSSPRASGTKPTPTRYVVLCPHRRGPGGAAAALSHELWSFGMLTRDVRAESRSRSFERYGQNPSERRVAAAFLLFFCAQVKLKHERAPGRRWPNHVSPWPNAQKKKMSSQNTTQACAGCWKKPQGNHESIALSGERGKVSWRRRAESVWAPNPCVECRVNAFPIPGWGGSCWCFLCASDKEAIAALKHSFYFLRETLLLLTLQPASGVLLQSACSGCVGLP